MAEPALIPRLHYRVDLDKTYLATPFEQRRAMLRLPFEGPEAKRTLPGMAALMRGIKQERGDAVDQVSLTVLSASPTFMEETLKAKLDLDGLNVDRLILKDQWDLLKQRRFREIVQPFVYKLSTLARLGRQLGYGDREIMIGDDWDQDPLIYSTYAALREGTMPEGVWIRLLSRYAREPELMRTLRQSVENLRSHDTVARIFIRREKRRAPEFYEAYGGRIRTYDDAFQLALMLYDLEVLGPAAVRDVVEELQQRRWRATAFRFSWQSLISEQYLERFNDAERLLEELEILPKRGLLQRVFARKPEAPDPTRPPDWKAIMAHAPA